VAAPQKLAAWQMRSGKCRVDASESGTVRHFGSHRPQNRRLGSTIAPPAVPTFYGHRGPVSAIQVTIF